ncbi:uncharacterized protein PHACADRAFT_107712 [Phanerochaete carnosa HHB-10118-sp]|uniref:Uncharacterized protein n=1 Tax=Phanerochaete carnosa (strain HHB-10118-sp) TaxID=650164 RepID=K5VR13_PHACS|nr:uncharacterized protein PHACADRAFT_107712 [Phanerochaete carnosa HHB-10118-sp]EKM49014.1 hypothetical protein PHACADRAFT_107712 [Phanerochaete carnosa HHB-10118-sp]
MYHNKDSQIIREAKIYAALLVAQQRDEDQSVEKAPWQPSKEFKTNVRAWTLGVFLSPCLPAYKGDIAVNRMTSVIKRERSVFELPPNNDKDFAKWGTITDVIEDMNTDIRRRFKAYFERSVQGPNTEHWTIYALTQKMCCIYTTKGTSMCKPSVPLCARAAFLRKCFMKNSQRDFWDSVDANLRSLREKLGGDETKISDYFRDTLKEDRRIHGVENMAESASLPRTANVWQREIDEIVNNAD